jgi:hypothetical protein
LHATWILEGLMKEGEGEHVESKEKKRRKNDSFVSFNS